MVEMVYFDQQSLLPAARLTQPPEKPILIQQNSKPIYEDFADRDESPLPTHQLKIEDIIDSNELVRDSGSKGEFYRGKCAPSNNNPNFKVFLFDCFAHQSDIGDCFKYLSSVSIFAYHTLVDKIGSATFITISTRKFGFVFNMNEDQ